MQSYQNPNGIFFCVEGKANPTVHMDMLGTPSSRNNFGYLKKVKGHNSVKSQNTTKQQLPRQYGTYIKIGGEINEIESPEVNSFT